MLNGNLAVTLQVLAVVLVAEVVVTCSGETAHTPAISPLEVRIMQVQVQGQGLVCRGRGCVWTVTRRWCWPSSPSPPPSGCTSPPSTWSSPSRWHCAQPLLSS